MYSGFLPKIINEIPRYFPDNFIEEKILNNEKKERES